MNGALRSSLVLAVLAAALGACGGQEPPPKPVAAPVPVKDPAWLAGVAQACARVASCAHGHDIPRLRDPGTCVDYWLSRGDPRTPDPLQKCLSAAKTCEEAEVCVHGAGDAKAAAFCAARPGVVSGCDGDRLVSCGDDDAQESTVTDCTALGATCREMRATGGLVVRACYAPQKCPAGAPEARCDGGGAVLGCHDGAIERVTCPAGTTCIEHKDESGEATASCRLAGRPGPRRCDALGARRCEGDRLVECSGDGSRLRVTDCVGAGLRCTGAGPRAGCYVPANVECDKEMLPKCENGDIVFCAAGRLERVSCGAIGMGACNPNARGLVAACSARPRTP